MLVYATTHQRVFLGAVKRDPPCRGGKAGRGLGQHNPLGTPMSPEAVLRRLNVACQKWWFFTLLTTTVLAACLCFAVALTLMTADAFVRFNQIGLAAALGSG